MNPPLRTDFNDFLFAPVADDANGMHLTLLSVLARRGVDPWIEAADLAALSPESATQKLIALLAGVPNGPPPGADTANVASRLVALLHAPRRKGPAAAAASTAPNAPVQMEPPSRAKVAIYYVLALLALLLGTWAIGSRDEPAPQDTTIPAPL